MSHAKLEIPKTKHQECGTVWKCPLEMHLMMTSRSLRISRKIRIRLRIRIQQSDSFLSFPQSVIPYVLLAK